MCTKLHRKYTKGARQKDQKRVTQVLATLYKVPRHPPDTCGLLTQYPAVCLWQQLSFDELLLENQLTSEERHLSTLQAIQTQDPIYFRKKDNNIKIKFSKRARVEGSPFSQRNLTVSFPIKQIKKHINQTPMSHFFLRKTKCFNGFSNLYILNN